MDLLTHLTQSHETNSDPIRVILPLIIINNYEHTTNKQVNKVTSVKIIPVFTYFHNCYKESLSSAIDANSR